MIKEIKCFLIDQTNCYLFVDENKNCAIFDCDKYSQELTDYIDKNSLKPLYILLTHGHADHIRSVNEVRKKYGCLVGCGEFEKEVLEDTRINLTPMFGESYTVKADKFFKDGDIVKVGSMEFKVMYTPGHTVGSVCYIIENYIISGDTLFWGSCGRTDFPTGDYRQMNASLERLKNLKGDYTVLPGHGPKTNLDYERKMNMFMR